VRRRPDELHFALPGSLVGIRSGEGRQSQAPIQIEQGESDTTVFKVFTDQLKNELDAAGNQVIYRTYPGVNHTGVVTTGEPDALAFFRQMLHARR
jgi:dienelactone hydrolase